MIAFLDDLSLKYECVMYSCTSSIFHDDFAQVTETVRGHRVHQKCFNQDKAQSFGNITCDRRYINDFDYLDITFGYDVFLMLNINCFPLFVYTEISNLKDVLTLQQKKTAEDLVAVEPPLPLQEALPLAPDVEVQNKRKYKRWLLEMTTDLVDAIGTLGGNDKATPTDVLRLISIKHNNLIKEEVEEKLKRWRKAQRANT